MNLKEHRIYIHLSEPWRLVGLTKDEMIIGLICFVGAALYKNYWVKGFLIIGGIFTIWSLKKFKKKAKGFSFMSWVHWTFGIKPKGCPNWPHSSQRWWLS